MTFKPKQFSNGDYVFINEPISNAAGTFAADTEFEIVGIYIRDGIEYYDLRDHDQNLLFGVPASEVRLSHYEGTEGSP